MLVTLTLRAADGTIILETTIRVRGLTSLAGEVGQAAHALYGQAKERGHEPIGTTLTVTDAEPLEIPAPGAIRRKRSAGGRATT